MAEPDCQPQACNLQSCLNKNTYNPERCDKLLKDLYICCKSMYDRDERAESSACPLPRVVERWIKDHGDPSS